MSRAVERILANVAESQRRITRAREAVAELTMAERDVFLAELIAQAEAGGEEASSIPEAGVPEKIETGAAPVAVAEAEAQPLEQQPAEVRTRPAYVPYTDYAEREVLSARFGLTTAQVAERIGQSPACAYGTLRQVMRTRRTIQRLDGKWYPFVEGVAPGRRKTMREAIIDVLSDGQARGTGDLFIAAAKVLPGLRKPSLAAEVFRMKKDGLLVEKGLGPFGALYGLLSGGTHEPALN